MNMNRLTITMKLTFDTALHTTGNIRRLGADKAVARSAAGEPILPATTLKGFLREKAEILLRTWGHSVCHGPEPDQMCKGPHFCAVCRVFGNPRYPSPLRFNDVRLSQEEENLPIRSGVAISRNRRAAFPQRLFFVETIPSLPDRPIRGQTECEGNFPNPNATQEAAALIALAARWGFAIGGGKTRGLGWIRDIEVEAEIDGQPLSEAALWKIWQDWGKGIDVAQD